MSGPGDEKSGHDPLEFHGWELVNMSFSTRQVKGQRRVIFFDAAGTLFHLAKPVGDTYAYEARQSGAVVTAEKVNRAFRDIWRTEPPRPSTGQPRDDDDRPWWKHLAQRVLRSAADLPADFPMDDWFMRVYHHYAQPDAWVLYDDVVSTLTLLSENSRLAVISNFDGRLRGILAGLGIDMFFEQIFISSEVGSDKPDRYIFDFAVARMGVSAAECWHVGDDDKRDWAGAEAAGLIPFCLDRPKNTLADLL